MSLLSTGSGMSAYANGTSAKLQIDSNYNRQLSTIVWYTGTIECICPFNGECSCNNENGYNHITYSSNSQTIFLHNLMPNISFLPLYFISTKEVNGQILVSIVDVFEIIIQGRYTTSYIIIKIQFVLILMSY